MHTCSHRYTDIRTQPSTYKNKKSSSELIASVRLAPIQTRAFIILQSVSATAKPGADLCESTQGEKLFSVQRRWSNCGRTKKQSESVFGAKWGLRGL